MKTTWLALLAALLLTGCNWRKTIVVIEKPAPLCSTWDACTGRQPKGHVITMLEAGTKVEMLRSIERPDHAAYQVQLKDGRIGYIISGTEFHVAR